MTKHLALLAAGVLALSVVAAIATPGTAAASGGDIPTGTTLSVTPPPAPDVYIADADHNRVVKVPAGGGQEIAVGTGLNEPSGVAVDAAGDVYIADYGHNRVVKVPAGGGQQTTVVTGLNGPQGMAVDAAGDVYIADTFHSRVVKVPAGGGAQTTVGTGLYEPQGVAVDAAGDVYIADSGHSRVVKVPAGGGAQTTVGTGLRDPSGVAIDAAGDVYIADLAANRGVVELPAGGGAQTTVGTGLNGPFGVSVDAAGNVYIADISNNRVVKVPADGGAQTTVGTELNHPYGVAIAVPAAQSTYGSPVTLTATVQTSPPGGTPTGTVTFTDGSGTLGTAPVTGSGPYTATLTTSSLPVGTHHVTARYGGDADLAASAPSAPVIVVVGKAPTGTTVTVTPPPAPDVYVADSDNGTVVKVPGDGGPKTTIATGLDLPYGMAVDAAGNVYIADTGHSKVVKVPADGGTPTPIGTGLAAPEGVAVDAAGNVYIADTGHDRVVKVPADGGTQTTIVSGLHRPFGVAVDAAGDVYIAQPFNDRVVTVPAGGGVQATVGTGLSEPQGVAVDAAGNVYIADTGHNRIVEVPADGGTPTTIGTGLQFPSRVAVGFAPAAQSTYGSPVTLTATVQTSPPGGAPSGTVTFKSGSTTLGTAPVTGSGPYTATLTTSSLPAGTQHVTASYGGDADFAASAASAPVTVDVAKATQKITFTSSVPDDATIGQWYTPSATASSGLPVTLSVDTSAAGVCSLRDDGMVMFTGAGRCVVDANQAGNKDYLAAKQVQQSFTVAKESQELVFTSTAPKNAVVGGTYTPTAMAQSSLPVTLSIDRSAVDVCSLGDDGSVSFTGAGSCVIDANQAGNKDYLAAKQVQQSFDVAGTAPTISASGSDSFTVSKVGRLTFTASGTPAPVLSESGDLPKGLSFTVSDDGSATITGTPKAGTAGSYPVTVTATNALGLLTKKVTVTVGRVPTTLTVSGPESAAAGDAVTLSAQVTGGDPPSGTVTFMAGSTELGTAALDADGRASLSTSDLPAGTDSVTASYSGDGTFQPATAEPITVTVAAAPVTTTSPSPSTTSTPSPTTTSSSPSTTTTPPPSTTTVAPTLPNTGVPAGSLAALAGLLLAGGVILLVAVRRSRGRHAER